MSCDKVSVDLDISIRPAADDDLDELRVLDHKVFGEIAYPAFVLRQLFDMYQRYWLLAVGPDGGLVGYSLGAPQPDRTGAWLLGLAVAPECRKLGIGERLTLESLALLRSEGVQTVYLTVEPNNAIAIALYERVGFAFSKLGPDYFGAGEDRVIMAHTFTRSRAIPAPRLIS